VPLLENVFSERVSENPIFLTVLFAPADQNRCVIWKNFSILFMFMLIISRSFLKYASLVCFSIWWLIPIDHYGSISEDLLLDGELSLMLLFVTFADTSDASTMRKRRASL
jgi:hypothetical protein